MDDNELTKAETSFLIIQYLHDNGMPDDPTTIPYAQASMINDIPPQVVLDRIPVSIRKILFTPTIPQLSLIWFALKFFFPISASVVDQITGNKACKWGTSDQKITSLVGASKTVPVPEFKDLQHFKDEIKAGNASLDWHIPRGVLFEGRCLDLLGKEKKVYVFASPSFLCAAMPRMRASPDGIGFDPVTGDIFTIECKAPFSKYKDVDISIYFKKHVGQVQLQLASVPEAKYGLFATYNAWKDTIQVMRVERDRTWLERNRRVLMDADETITFRRKKERVDLWTWMRNQGKI